ncbi:MAG: hypothetical protein ACFCUE_09635 [Candidatus Bathyarchaeia archaeon]|jgi:hypothetical protein
MKGSIMHMGKHVKEYLAPAVLIAVMLISTFTIYTMSPTEAEAKADPNVNVGIAFCGNTTAEAKLLIDRTKDYTNLFVLDSGGGLISQNRTQIEEICDYAVSQGLKVIVNLGTIYTDSWFWKTRPIKDVTDSWQQRWGDNFLGIYYNDEPAGIQLDGNWTDWFNRYNSSLNLIDHPTAQLLDEIFAKMETQRVNGTHPSDYNAEAELFIQGVVREDPGMMLLENTSLNLFTADYCLHWFDYLGGYDTMFAELGWNSSVTQQISLVKGAARLQNKTWGTIITWKYEQPPYLDSGQEIYSQMLESYKAGADYIIIFNYPILSSYGVMKTEHFTALRNFWNDITTKSLEDLSQPEAVLVLPQNYGWGIRHQTDNIWGFYTPDDKAPLVANAMETLLAQYGASLDIVYDDPAHPVNGAGYQTVYYWNQTL